MARVYPTLSATSICRDFQRFELWGHVSSGQSGGQIGHWKAAAIPAAAHLNAVMLPALGDIYIDRDAARDAPDRCGDEHGFCSGFARNA
jgi:hypothetical protein